MSYHPELVEAIAKLDAAGKALVAHTFAREERARIPTPETDKISAMQRTSGEWKDHSQDIERRLTIARAAIQAAIDSGLIPVSSASEGGPMRHSAQVRAADQIREALTLTAPKP